MSEPHRTSTREKVAGTVSVIIVVATVIYWVVQIQGVMEELKMAAGL